jgi:Na+/proline symporter
MGALSVAEVMGNLYGKHVRLITAISAIAWNIGGIAIQFKVFGTLFNYFLGIPGEYAIILASTIVIIYTAFGGIKAVTYTDVVQFFTFGFVLPTIAIIIWGDFQSLGLTLTDASQNRLFDYHELFNMRGYQLADFILLVLYFSFPAIGPIHFQRISMARNITQAKKAWVIASLIFIVIKLTIAWIPFLLLTINPDLEPNQVVSYLIDNYTNLPLIKGLLIIGVSAMAMSSADSFINGSAVLFAHDIKEVLKIKTNDLILSKLFSIILGAFAVYLALSTNDLLAMIMNAASFYLPIVSVPLLLAIFGFRSSTKSVLIAMGTGFATVILWKILDIKLNSIIFAMLANLIAFIASHYLLKQPGGWVGIKDREYLDYTKKIKKRKRAAFLHSIWNFNLIKFCKNSAPKNELGYMFFGIYLILYSFTTM